MRLEAGLLAFQILSGGQAILTVIDGLPECIYYSNKGDKKSGLKVRCGHLDKQYVSSETALQGNRDFLDSAYCSVSGIK